VADIGGLPQAVILCHQGFVMNSNRSADLAALILRVALGVLYLAHSLQKIFAFTLPGTAQFFA
jgi:uncharacterized membrane protein YphA (DoxX/SURF4 family)